MKPHDAPTSAGAEAFAEGQPARPLGHGRRPRGPGRRARRLIAVAVLAAAACFAAARLGGRLVLVGCAVHGGGLTGTYDSMVYGGSSAEPAGWLGGELRWRWTTLVPVGFVEAYFDVSTDPPTAWPTFVLYAGHPDPADESHFTIAFQFRGSSDRDWRPGLIDGWLRDDDSVSLAVRDPEQYDRGATHGWSFHLGHSP